MTRVRGSEMPQNSMMSFMDDHQPMGKLPIFFQTRKTNLNQIYGMSLRMHGMPLIVILHVFSPFVSRSLFIPAQPAP